MRKIAYLLLTICISVLGASAAPVDTMLGSDGTERSNDPWMPTASDYIQDGLLVLWDGIENVEWGVHNNIITTWTDLVSGLTIPNVTVVDDMAIDFTNNGYSKYFPLIGNIVSSGYMTFEVATQEQEVYTSCWHQRSRNGGTSWSTSLEINWSYIKFFSQVLNFPKDTIGPDTRVITADGETVKGWCGGVQYAEKTIPEPHIDEGRCLFDTGRKICCVRFYDRPLSAEEIRHNNLVDKMRFGL